MSSGRKRGQNGGHPTEETSGGPPRKRVRGSSTRRALDMEEAGMGQEAASSTGDAGIVEAEEGSSHMEVDNEILGPGPGPGEERSSVVQAAGPSGLPSVEATKEDVHAWALSLQGVDEEDAAVLLKQKIDGDCLRTVTKGDLRDCGMSFGAAIKICRAVSEHQPSVARGLPASREIESALKSGRPLRALVLAAQSPEYSRHNISVRPTFADGTAKFAEQRTEFTNNALQRTVNEVELKEMFERAVAQFKNKNPRRPVIMLNAVSGSGKSYVLDFFTKAASERSDVVTAGISYNCSTVFTAGEFCDERLGFLARLFYSLATLQPTEWDSVQLFVGKVFRDFVADPPGCHVVLNELIEGTEVKDGTTKLLLMVDESAKVGSVVAPLDVSAIDSASGPGRGLADHLDEPSEADSNGDDESKRLQPTLFQITSSCRQESVVGPQVVMVFTSLSLWFTPEDLMAISRSGSPLIWLDIPRPDDGRATLVEVLSTRPVFAKMTEADRLRSINLLLSASATHWRTLVTLVRTVEDLATFDLDFPAFHLLLVQCFRVLDSKYDRKRDFVSCIGPICVAALALRSEVVTNASKLHLAKCTSVKASDSMPAYPWGKSVVELLDCIVMNNSFAPGSSEQVPMANSVELLNACHALESWLYKEDCHRRRPEDPDKLTVAKLYQPLASLVLDLFWVLGLWGGSFRNCTPAWKMLEQTLAVFLACKLSARAISINTSRQLSLLGTAGLFHSAWKATRQGLPQIAVNRSATIYKTKRSLGSHVQHWSHLERTWTAPRQLHLPAVILPGDENQPHSDFAIAVEIVDDRKAIETEAKYRPGLILVQCKMTMPTSKKQGRLSAKVIENALKSLVTAKEKLFGGVRTVGNAKSIVDLGVAEEDVIYVLMADRDMLQIVEHCKNGTLQLEEDFKGHVLVLELADIQRMLGQTFAPLLHFIRDPEVAKLHDEQQGLRPHSCYLGI